MRWLSQRPSLALGQAMEIGFISLFAFVLALWARPTDPLGLTSHFPWIWFAPVLIALRYGTGGGMASLAVLFLGWLITGADILSTQSGYETLYAGLILVLLIGEFGRHWNARLRRIEKLNQYLDETLRALTQEHYLLKLSHDRLESYLLAKPHTLRSALVELRSLTQGAQEELPAAQSFLALLSTYCELRCAGLYVASSKGLATQPIARWEEPGPLDPNDPLVRHALEQKNLAHLRMLDQQAMSSSHYLVAAPIFSRGKLRALLAAKQMPFLAFHEENLKRMAALVSYYGMLLERLEVRFKDAPPEFVDELIRLAQLRKDTDIVSYLAVILFPSSGTEAREQIAKTKRQLDLYWLRDTPTPRLFVLLPLTDRAGLDGYRARLDLWFEERYGRDLRLFGARFYGEPVDAQNPLRQLERLMEV